MAPAVITKAQQQELAAVMIPLLRKQLTADVLKAAKRPPTPKAKSTPASSDTTFHLLERMIRVEEELKLVHVEIKHLHTETKHLHAEINQLRKDFAVQIDRIDKRFEHMENTFNARFEQMERMFNKGLSAQRWFIGALLVAIPTAIALIQFLIN